MAGPNSEPLYSRVGKIQWAVNCTAANNTIDITSGTSYLVFTADATNGSYVRECIVQPSPSQNTAASVARFWMNNGSVTTTDTNSVLFAQLAIPATTAIATNSITKFSIPIDMILPPGYRIYVTFGTAPGGSGEFNVMTVGGDY
jgi:aconitase B